MYLSFEPSLSCNIFLTALIFITSLNIFRLTRVVCNLAISKLSTSSFQFVKSLVLQILMYEHLFLHLIHILPPR